MRQRLAGRASQRSGDLDGIDQAKPDRGRGQLLQEFRYVLSVDRLADVVEVDPSFPDLLRLVPTLEGGAVEVCEMKVGGIVFVLRGEEVVGIVEVVLLAPVWADSHGGSSRDPGDEASASPA